MWNPNMPPRPLSEVIDDCARHSLVMANAFKTLTAADEALQQARQAHAEAQKKGNELYAELQHAIYVFAQTLNVVATSSSESPQPPL